MEKMSRALERAKMLVGMEVDEEAPDEASSFFDDFNRQCTLSTKQRLYGFAICLGAGLACTFMSILVFFNPIKFGITFTFGNLLALGSTAFLIGPKRQFDMMLDPVRLYATAIYISSVIIALLCAFYVHNKLLTLLAIMLEFGALVWPHGFHIFYNFEAGEDMETDQKLLKERSKNRPTMLNHVQSQYGKKDMCNPNINLLLDLSELAIYLVGWKG